MKICKRDRWLQRGLRASWILLLLYFFYSLWGSAYAVYPTRLLLAHPAFYKDSPVSNQNSQVSAQGLRVYSDDKDDYKLWKRDDAIKFAYDKVSTTISYLFVGASVLLGLIGKFAIDPLLDDKKKNLIRSRAVLLLVRHAAYGCVISICYGFFAHLYFGDLADKEEFSINEQVGTAAFCQLIAFLMASLMLGVAIHLIVKRHLEANGEST